MEAIREVKYRFDEVPVDALGEPMLATSSEEDYRTYIAWLADYLFRPADIAVSPLSEKDAGVELVAIEMEIAEAIWTSPDGEYPPQEQIPATGARHADILHREALSRTLSRVPDRALREKLLHAFYVELDSDSRK